MADTTDKNEPQSKPRIGSTVTWLICGLIVFGFYESIVLIVIGMAPTAAAVLIDRSPQRNQAKTVGYLNFAGCLPWVIEYWLVGGGFQKVFEIVGDPFTLFIMYSAAACGWLLYFAIRPVVGSYLLVAADLKERQLQRRQKELVEDWGEEVRKDADGEGDEAAESETPAAAA